VAGSPLGEKPALCLGALALGAAGLWVYLRLGLPAASSASPRSSGP
jgi:hypothetical protein